MVTTTYSSALTFLSSFRRTAPTTGVQAQHPTVTELLGNTRSDGATVLFSLALIGIAGGLITGISPCIIPVLPVIFFSGGVQGARKVRVPAPDAAPVRVRSSRPHLVILGLVVSFSLFTLI